MDGTVQAPNSSSTKNPRIILLVGIILILLLSIDILIQFYPVVIGDNHKILLSSEANKISLFLPFERTDPAIYGAGLVYEFDGTVFNLNYSPKGKEIVLDKEGLPKFFVTSATNFFTLKGSTELIPASESELSVGSPVRIRIRYSIQNPVNYYLESVSFKVN